MSLTPRERLAKTLNHEDPGKVVVDYGSSLVTGINALAMSRLRDKLGLEKRPITIIDPYQMLGQIDEDLMAALGCDIVPVTDDMTVFGYKNENWKPFPYHGVDARIGGGFEVTIDKDGTTFVHPQGDRAAKPSAKMLKDGFFFDGIVRVDREFDEDNANPLDDFKDDFAVYSDEQLRTIEKKVDFYYNNTEYGIFASGALDGIGDYAFLSGPPNKHPNGIRDIAEWMVAYYTLPDYVHEVYGMQTEIGLKNAQLLKQACGDKIQVVMISGTDFGTQRGQFISNDLYREFYKPYFKKINDWVHQNTNWKTFYHTCGSVVSLLDDFHETGIDILNPVQCAAACMDPRMLKDKYGKKFVFWGGGVDSQDVLPFGTPEEVYSQVSERLSIFAPGGGFVFNTVHNIQAPTTPENILAMVKAVQDYNKNK